jgi:hypothetical protein
MTAMRAEDAGIRLCFCPLMDDRTDPEQHELGCLEAEARRIHAYWSENPPVWEPLLRPVTRLTHWAPPEIPPGCYEASFGWVHVKPGCRCPG